MPDAQDVLARASRPVPVTVRPRVAFMVDDTLPVHWTGKQAVVTLPEHVDHSNADQVREQLLWIISRGATVLIADLTGTVSCDYPGADALAQAQNRATANGIELRLVATGEVRDLLSRSGFDHLVAVHPDLAGAIAAGVESREPHGENETQILLGRTGDIISSVSSLLRAAANLPPTSTAQRITEAVDRLDDADQEIRNHLSAERGHDGGRGVTGPPPPDLRERIALARNHSLLLRMHVAQTARALQSAAADTAEMLERRGKVLDWHARIDYPKEIKRWRVFADQAGQMAERWEHEPLRPDNLPWPCLSGCHGRGPVGRAWWSAAHAPGRTKTCCGYEAARRVSWACCASAASTVPSSR